MHKLIAIVITLLLLAACSHRGDLPAANSTRYREFTSAFYVGLAGLQTGEDMRAQQKLTRASEIVPAEASTWANLALFYARQQNFEAASQNADKARERAPKDSRVQALIGAIEARRGKLPEAISHLKQAVELDSGNLKALYVLAEETERAGGPSNDAEAQKLLRQALSRQPDNVALLIDATRLAAKRGDTATLRDGIGRLKQLSQTWPQEARKRLAAIEEISASRATAVQVTFLRNVLARDPGYRQSLDAVKTPAAFVGEPFTRFLNLPNPSAEPAPPDTGLRFTARALEGTPGGEISWAGAMPLDASGKQYVITAEADNVRVSGGATLPRPKGAIGRNGVLGADINYDFKTDLIVAAAGGLRIYRQETPQQFSDITSEAKIAPAVKNGSYLGAWAFDVDLDGDLDIVLGDSVGEPTVLRNNGDTTFAIVKPFKEIRGLVSFAAADIDGDGDPDVAMVDSGGSLHVLSNERLGVFRVRSLPANVSGHFLSVTAGDIDGDGLPDFVALRDDGSVLRISDKLSGSGWDVATAIPANGPHLTYASGNLLLGDFDNNGALDLLAGDGRVFLSDGRKLTPVTAAGGFTTTTAVDLDNSGRLQLIGYGKSAVAFASQGAKSYHWQILRLRAAKASGDQRINSFGIGGEVEIRAGLLTQKQIISSPVLHFGLGDNRASDVARIVWPNGSVQAEFELRGNQSLLAEQRLKGSCPFLFAWNGKQMDFVKDSPPWSPALGLHINAQVVAGISQTQEWFKIPGDMLASRDGYYDLRITAELWETFYIDHYSLLVVDHPADSEIFTDERFSIPAPPLKVFTVSRLHPFASAIDDNGSDVGAIVRDTDGKYLDTFGRGRYQGVTRDHWVEVTLPEEAPRTSPLYLIGTGWMHPTDGTTNVALGQNSDPAPEALRIEVPDGHGGWKVARKGLGFLAGRKKNTVLEIGTLLSASGPRKLRLRTNLENYWDQLAWATGLPDSYSRVQRSPLIGANLRYRGFSPIYQANESSPEIPQYNETLGTGQKWRDLEGYSTRYGDVRELLEKIDDRFVITSAGDEIQLRFAEVAAPPAGMKRDYVIIGEGWIKDGDYNSVFSKTVLPLPDHTMKEYSVPPSTLENDPVYKAHRDDWQSFHTRYVTPARFIRALWER